jgi:glycosyltransferase involved in cell wall biosynthesis
LGGPELEQVALVVAGDGSERQRLQELADQLGVAKRVFLLGWRDDTELVLTESALFTMSSRSEGTSVSLLEAMSSGLCPVVTEVGGNAAVLGPELRHRLVAPESPEALAAAWRGALLDRASLQADAARARARVLSTFSIEQMVRSYEQLYVAGARRS